MEYIAVLEGLNGLQFSQRQSRKSLGSNSWSSVGSARQSVDCSPCTYEPAAVCGYEPAAVCGYEAAADCSYEAAPVCGYEGSFDCNAGCVETIPAYVPPPQVFVPQQPSQPQTPNQPQQALQPTPSSVPVATPGTPATVQYQLVPTFLQPGVVVNTSNCPPADRRPDGSCVPLQGISVTGVKGTLGRLGKVFGK